MQVSWKLNNSLTSNIKAIFYQKKFCKYYFSYLYNPFIYFVVWPFLVIFCPSSIFHLHYVTINNKNLIMSKNSVNSEANARRIALVESCFGSAGQPLGVPGRVLVGEGVLTKSCRKKPKPRQFFLFNDILVYGNIILQKKKYNKQHIIPLEEVIFIYKISIHKNVI